MAAVAAEDAVHKPGHIAVGRERVEIDIGPQHLESLDTIVDPLLVSDLATMVWAPHGHRAGVDALRRLASIVLIDTQDEPEVGAGVRARRGPDRLGLRGRPRVAALDPVARARRRDVRPAGDAPGARRDRQGRRAPPAGLRPPRACSSAAGSPSRLGWRPSALSHRGDQLTGHCRARRGEVALELHPHEMDTPGLGGVTIEMASGEAASLDRGPGGLRASRRKRDGEEQAWTVLGASRGESGILGEGVRQALLRDPTYKPALEAGRMLVG